MRELSRFWMRARLATDTRADCTAVCSRVARAPCALKVGL